ncbi:protein tweety homolog 3 [Tachysurus ichikawai]
MAAVVNYSPPWWVNLLHRLPHFNLRFEQISSEFQPEDSSYQQLIWHVAYSTAEGGGGETYRTPPARLLNHPSSTMPLRHHIRLNPTTPGQAFSSPHS